MPLRPRQLPFRFLAGVGYFVCTGVLVLTLLSIAAHIGLPLWPRMHKATVTDTSPANPVYANYPWAADCLKQQLAKERNAYLPFLLWGNTEVHGVCMNNDVTELGTVRRTIGPDCKNRPAIQLWVLGGSAAYGTMVPDWATLPSALSRILNIGARCVQVTNLAVEGYDSNQELLLLVEQLKAGHIPDAVVFYDGFNDADVGTSPSGPATHLRYTTIRQRLQGKLSISADLLPHFAIWRLADEITRSHDRTPMPRVPASELTERAVATLDNYSENLKIANVLGKTYGFRVCAFWQPALIYGHKPLVDYEQEFQRLSWQPGLFFQPLATVYRQAELREGEGHFIFLGSVFRRRPAACLSRLGTPESARKFTGRTVYRTASSRLHAGV